MSSANSSTLWFFSFWLIGFGGPDQPGCAARLGRKRAALHSRSHPELSGVKLPNTMLLVRLKIDVSGTVADAAWRKVQQFDQIQSAAFGPQFGSGGPCKHSTNERHKKGEWIGAEILVQTPLLAQYAISYYLEQENVLDADVVE